MQTARVDGAEQSLATRRAVLFDLDGTLADTAPDLVAAVNKMRRDRNTVAPAPRIFGKGALLMTRWAVSAA